MACLKKMSQYEKQLCARQYFENLEDEAKYKFCDEYGYLNYLSLFPATLRNKEQMVEDEKRLDDFLIEWGLAEDED